ncbi:MAG: aspartate aminotransferase family protein [Candidatus Rokuibacteriota bacterium]|nr:MAG: aspartate aminotransferase family protein [Candidatus Rokubacteria bacterium]PYN65613.1 MAG: aspartate aminotransferase family protein [Candidatus Rokubacteria bacterium]PYN92564.1 MAG: aspartate aminotransferase family protein [Candidatus Rokubacteria bacterium]
MTIHETFRAKHPKSAALAERARAAIPGGITHDIRHLKPFGVYVDRAAGTRKWDVDGHEYIDYWMGHGALFLGHCHPAVVKAVQAQVARGTHLGACHELEVRWAELVNQLVPSAELTRFTMSGTEATHLALRIARAFTGRSRILKFTGHFHGWHDGVAIGVNPPYEVPLSSGVPGATLDQVITCPPNDIKAVDTVLERGDVAAVILEPAGGQSGTTPTIPGYLQELRALTQRHGVLLIFDEVITGFRYAPGGAQEYFGVTPDITTLAKIVAGGLPGGAVCGRRDVLSMLAYRGDATWDRAERVAHAGTFNANPISASAAIATLEQIGDASLQARTNKLGEELRRGLTEAMKRAGTPGTCYGEASIYHVSFEGKPGLAGFDRPRKGDHYHLLRCAILNEGVDCSMNHGWVSAVHTEEDIERTIRAYDRAFRAMVAEGAFGR